MNRTVLCLLFAATAAYGQVVGATLSGTVTDPSGAAIPLARVTITNLATGVVTSITTNQDGVYNAPNLLPGEYRVAVEAAGFAAQERKGLILTVGEKQVLNVQMQMGAAATTLEVSAQAPPVELGSASVSAVVDGQTARELPLNGRDWTQLAQLQPGISPIRTQPDANGLNNRGNRGFGGQLTISGARPQQNNYRLDGISVNDYANSAPGSSIGLSLGAEAIQEFSVISSNYSADYGMTSGGVVNAMTRAGANSLHGSAYEFLRNDAVDARGFFDGSKLPFRRNQFGGSLGGALVKNKLFLFGNYEGLRQSLTTTTIDTVPSLNARNGQLVAGTVQVNPAVQRYLGLLAPPNGAVNGDTAIYTFGGKAVTPENFFTTRADYTVSERDSIHGTYLLDRGSTAQPDALNVISNLNQVRRQVASVEETHVFSPAIVNSARFGANRVVAATLQTASGANPLGADNSLGVLPGLYAPAIQVTGLTAFQGGLNGTSYGNYWFTTWQFYDDAFLTKGKHTLKFGAAVERIDSNFLLAANPDGVFRFNTLSDFLLNKPASFQFQYGVLTPRGLRQSVYAGYVQDDFRVRSNLTVNVGVRYEMATVPYEVNGKLANLRTLGSSQIYTGSPFFNNPTTRNFEPRVGLAWDPFGDGRTSVRAGFGVFDSLPLTYQFNLAEVSASPFQSTASTTALPQGAFPGGAVALVQQGSGLRTTYIEFNPKRNYVMQWNASVQREVVRNLTVMAAYLGSRGVHNAMRSTDANGVIPYSTPRGLLWPCAGTISAAGICSKPGGGVTFNPAYGQIDAQVWNGNSFYDALLVSARRRLAAGLEVQASFTWAKSLDTSSSVGSGGPFSNSISGQFLFAPIKSLSDFSLGRNLVFSGTWQIPLARTKPWGGWQLGSIVTVSDGLPFTVVNSGDVLGQSNQSNFDVPNRLALAGCGTPVNTGNTAQYIRLSCFAMANPSTLFGDAGRNELIGPGVIDADLSLFKNFAVRRISDTARVQFRAEAFNIPNRPNFGPPTANNKLFSTTGAPVAFAGQITTLSTTPREIQFGLKLLW